MTGWSRYKARWARHDYTTGKDLVEGKYRAEPWPDWARRCLFDVTIEVSILGLAVICHPFDWYLSWNRGILKIGPFYAYME